MTAKHHAYVVTWQDSSTLYGWQPIASVKDEVATAITTVGWLVNKTRRTLTLTTSITECGKVLDAVSIPRAAVLKMTKLKNRVGVHV